MDSSEANELIIQTGPVPILGMKRHPRNYQSHPEDQIEHLQARLRKFGFYRNVVLARDYTILAGHGIVEAAKGMGIEEAPGVILDLDPNEPRAIEVLTGDNETSRLAERDDRLLSELLKEIQESPEADLEGTGFDEQQLANLIYVTRPASEVKDFDAAAHWAGLPEYEPAPEVLKVVVNCETEEDRADFLYQLGVSSISKNTRGTLSIWWPLRERESVTPIRFEEEGEEDEEAS